MPTFAVFIDVENVRSKSLNPKKLVEYFSARGDVAICRAIARAGQFAGLEKQLELAEVERIEYPRHAKGRNRADIHIVVDALELIWTRPEIDTFVIVSGDSDFVPLIRKLRSYNRQVIVLGGPNNCSQTLKNVSNRYLGINMLTQGDEAPTTVSAKCLTRLYWAAKLLDDARCQLESEGFYYAFDQQQTIGHINSALQMLYPKFCVQQFGYPKKLGLAGVFRKMESDDMCRVLSNDAGYLTVVFTEKFLTWRAADVAPTSYDASLARQVRNTSKRIRLHEASGP